MTWRERWRPLRGPAIDGDPYENVKTCFDHLHDRVNSGSVIPIDDYESLGLDYTWRRVIKVGGAAIPPSDAVCLVSRSWTDARRWTIAVGIFLVVSVVYMLSGPGRIDIIDGQLRYEVTVNLLNEGRPVIRDPALRWAGLPGRERSLYSYYNAGASIAGLPFVWLGRVVNRNEETQRFLFSLTSAVAGGLIAASVYIFYRMLGVQNHAALGWVGVSTFGTLIWPLATSTFDQVQHAALVLLAVLLGRASARRDSIWLAVAGGLAAAALLNYLETYLLLIPALALSTLSWNGRFDFGQGSCNRCLGFLVTSGIGVVGWLTYNAVRFGEPFYFAAKLPEPGHPAASILTSPVPGFLGLLVSPGKSILLYSPPLVLGLLGLRGLRRKDPVLGLVLMAVSAVQLFFVSSLRFFGSDWAWGPRYLVPLLPLWALAFPFVSTATIRRSIQIALVSVGVLVQLMGLSLDHQRFFFERGLPPFFWAVDPWFYFRESALLARPGEIAVSLRDGVPSNARRFAPGPYPEAVTYSIFGYFRPDLAPMWMRGFQVFYLPRPWPLWMRAIQPDRRPVALGATVLGLVVVGVSGVGLIHRGISRVSTPETT
jgi:hypothetical protein